MSEWPLAGALCMSAGGMVFDQAGGPRLGCNNSGETASHSDG
jgi:hypothetical protein